MSLADRTAAIPSDPTALPLPAPAACPVLDWLLVQGRYAATTDDLVRQTGRRLAASGVAVARMAMIVRTLHPLLEAQGRVWRGDDDSLEHWNAEHDSVRSEAWERSPFRTLFEGAPGIRRRLADPACPRDYPILDELAEEGATDYLALPLPWSDGRNYALSFTSFAPGGLDDAAVARLVALVSPFAFAAEVLETRMVAETVAATYLGRHTGARVMAGAITRGSHEYIRAVVWYSDLRGYTAFSDRYDAEAVLALLDEHYGALVTAIDQAGGEVLKFMGDALLAILPVIELGGPGEAAAAAIAAVDAAQAATAASNARREAAAEPAIRWGVALHIGEVVYGNIGARDRLDFTVVGPAVNHAARIAGQCGRLDRPVLLSAAFAEVCDWPVVALGAHALRGVREPQDLFAPVLEV